MAALPPCSLCRVPEKVSKFLDNKKSNFLKFAIFFILLIEWFSNLFVKNYSAPLHDCKDVYLTFVYPLLSQLALFIMFFSIFLWKDRLHFCSRKSATTFYLSLYYLFGVVSLVFCLSANIYYTLISYAALAFASLLFVASFYNKLN